MFKNIETGEFRSYHASNKSLMLDTAVLISNEAELNEFLAKIADEDFLDFVSRPDTKWQLYQITNLLFFVNHLKRALLGAPFHYRILSNVIMVSSMFQPMKISAFSVVLQFSKMLTVDVVKRRPESCLHNML